MDMMRLKDKVQVANVAKRSCFRTTFFFLHLQNCHQKQFFHFLVSVNKLNTDRNSPARKHFCKHTCRTEESRRANTSSCVISRSWTCSSRGAEETRRTVPCRFGETVELTEHPTWARLWFVGACPKHSLTFQFFCNDHCF